MNVWAGSGASGSVIAAFGIGIALGGVPGMVQAVLLSEAVRGGVARGFRVMAGASLTFALLLGALALGVSAVAPGRTATRILEVAGGALLLWLAMDGLRADRQTHPAPAQRHAVPAAVRGSLSVLLNPGSWLFLGTVAPSLLAAASRAGGIAGTAAAALALLAGLAISDGAVVVLGGIGLRRGGEQLGRWVRRSLAGVLGVLGLWFVLAALKG